MTIGDRGVDDDNGMESGTATGSIRNYSRDAADDVNDYGDSTLPQYSQSACSKK